MANPNPSKKWKKGQSGNPKGRPLLNEELMLACRKFMNDEGLEILKKHARGTSKGERMKALEAIMDRGYGKAIQPTKELKTNESYQDFLRAIMDEKKDKK